MLVDLLQQASQAAWSATASQVLQLRKQRQGLSQRCRMLQISLDVSLSFIFLALEQTGPCTMYQGRWYIVGLLAHMTLCSERQLCSVGTHGSGSVGNNKLIYRCTQ